MGYCLRVGATQDAAHLNASVNLFFWRNIFMSALRLQPSADKQACVFFFFRKDRLGQLGFVTGSARVVRISQTMCCQSRPSHKNKSPQWKLMLQEIRNANRSLKRCHTIVPPATFGLFPALFDIFVYAPSMIQYHWKHNSWIQC